MVNFFIHRPIFASSIAIIMVLAGAIALRFLPIAQLPEVTIHMVGGPVPAEAALYKRIRRAAARYPNVTFHGHLSYWEANVLYGRARLLANTSEVEGFPNAYLQAWSLGVPVVSFTDPDSVIRRHGLGAAVSSEPGMRDAIRRLLDSAGARAAAGVRCREYMAREYAEEIGRAHV